jgi:uncharacterized BrkB/YihY/UPF0761 family membrane protein
MAARLTIKLSPLNIAMGVASVILGLALFTWLLPLFLPAELIYAVAGAAIGILAWFLYMLARQEGL